MLFLQTPYRLLKVACLLLMSLSSLSAFSQDDNSARLDSSNHFTVQQAKEFALIHHYKAKNSSLDIQIAEKKIWETIAIGLPQISGAASYRNSLDLEFSFPDEAVMTPGNEFISIFAADNVSQGKLEATQLLFDGTYIVGLQAAKTYLKLSENQKTKTAIEVKTGVTSSYYLILVADENIAILEKNLLNIEQSIGETRALVKEGFLEETDLNQLELTQAKLLTSQRNSKLARAVALNMLKLNMGFPMEQELNLSDKLTTALEASGLDALTESNFNISANADFNTLTTQRKLLALDVKKYKMQKLPTIAAFYQYTNTAYQLEFDFYKGADWLDAQTIGISLSVPIWSSGMQGAKIKQAKLTLMKMDNSMNNFESATALQYDNSISELKAKMANKENAAQSVKIAQKIFDKTEIKYKEGLSSSFELTQMKNQLLDAQGMYIRSIFELLNAKVELNKLQNKL